MLGYIFLEENKDKVRAVEVGGAVPTETSITDLSYPGARRIYVYAKGEHLEAKPAIKQFLSLYARSNGKGGSLERRGLVPFGDADAAAAQQQAVTLKPLTAADLK